MDAFDHNFSLFTIPAAFVLLFIPKLYSFALGGRYLDPANPRKYRPAISDAKDIDPIVSTILSPKSRRDSLAKAWSQVKGRILRAESAFANGLETLSLYAAAVVSVNVAAADVSPSVANALAVSYLGTRVAYNVVYVVLQDNPRWALVRSGTWFAGIGIIFTMFFISGSGLYS
ncbi:hypothetical protein GGR56DRAFT_86930 [Xylariaceae sp. FL0804]|nr:hypothetical protein GGR56DRAFT_86930 [Xylariaceae sp. FL0804]